MTTSQGTSKRQRHAPKPVQQKLSAPFAWDQTLTPRPRTLTRAPRKRNAADDKAFMPACGRDLRLVPNTKMSEAALTTFIPDISVDAGIPQKEASTYTTRSMKAKYVSWTGTVGTPEAYRRILGGHARLGEMMVNRYSRDKLAEPYRQLGNVLIWVASGGFNPDATKSGKWTRNCNIATKTTKDERRLTNLSNT